MTRVRTHNPIARPCRRILRWRNLGFWEVHQRRASRLPGPTHPSRRGCNASHISDAEVRASLTSNRGFGNCSAQYILERGLGRSDCLASDDIGLRRVVGKYLACGRRLTPEDVEHVLLPCTPFRGFAPYYLAVHARHCDNPGGEPAGRSVR
jgi:hypothetical protein